MASNVSNGYVRHRLPCWPLTPAASITHTHEPSSNRFTKQLPPYTSFSCLCFPLILPPGKPICPTGRSLSGLAKTLRRRQRTVKSELSTPADADRHVAATPTIATSGRASVHRGPPIAPARRPRGRPHQRPARRAVPRSRRSRRLRLARRLLRPPQQYCSPSRAGR